MDELPCLQKFTEHVDLHHPKAAPTAVELLRTSVKIILKSSIPYTSLSLSWKEMEKEGVGLWVRVWGSLGCGDGVKIDGDG